ncbi:MAG TPA: tRNA (adenosine(37)-N6)-threonylcarbamoyltransferase complex ATPase subunit type 1 TsaE [Bacteroidia bacterium]|jgi:tRNA threonylcarbamoyladenosine biosynthesis protein TsaE|nr:tRNA (adenosine(37)-N6)-threonylcarbamoyltransferase complex ATPase subunit type 1 TsaE [Bacteroidia bacterium]
MKQHSIEVHTLSELQAAAREMLRRYPQHKIIAFRGTMGAGKTTFIKAICRELGAGDQTSSPSFSIVNEYRGKEGVKLYHFDFYRIQAEKEASDLGLEEYLESGAWCFMEWPEKVEALLPADCLFIDIKVSGDIRSISFSPCP